MFKNKTNRKQYKSIDLREYLTLRRLLETYAGRKIEILADFSSTTAFPRVVIDPFQTKRLIYSSVSTDDNVIERKTIYDQNVSDEFIPYVYVVAEGTDDNDISYWYFYDYNYDPKNIFRLWEVKKLDNKGKHNPHLAIQVQVFQIQKRTLEMEIVLGADSFLH